MLRVPKAELPTELSDTMLQQFGAVPEPVEVTWNNPGVAQAALEFGAKAGQWDAVDENLKSFAHMAVASRVGCSWCLDIGYFQAENQKLDLTKASQCRDGVNPTCSRRWNATRSSMPRRSRTRRRT